MKNNILIFVFCIFLLSSIKVIAADEVDYCKKYEKEIISLKGYGNISEQPCTPWRRQDLSNQIQIIKNGEKGTLKTFRYQGKKYHGKVFRNHVDFEDYVYDIFSIETKSINDKDLICINSEFTNNSDKPTSYNNALYCELYQDGIQIDNYVMTNVDTMTKIQPGLYMEVTECFEYRKPIKNGIVEILIHPYFDGSPEHTYSGVIYKLK